MPSDFDRLKERVEEAGGELELECHKGVEQKSGWLHITFDNHATLPTLLDSLAPCPECVRMREYREPLLEAIRGIPAEDETTVVLHLIYLCQELLGTKATLATDDYPKLPSDVPGEVDPDKPMTEIIEELNDQFDIKPEDIAPEATGGGEVPNEPS